MEKDGIKNAFADMSLADLVDIRDSLSETIRVRAEEELGAHRDKENELRMLAGKKRRPGGPRKSASPGRARSKKSGT